MKTCLNCYNLVCKPFKKGILNLLIAKTRVYCKIDCWPYISEELGISGPRKKRDATIAMIQQKPERYGLFAKRCEYFEGEE